MDLGKLSNPILNNSLILENIFRYLKLKDHLNLIHVCQEFRETVVQFLWRSRCKHLKLIQRIEHYFVNLSDTEMCCMKERGIREFLKLNRYNVHRLELRSCTSSFIFRIIEDFENLTYLDMLQCRISNNTLEMMARNCRTLRTLILDRCNCTHCNEDLVLGQELKIETLARMPSLQELSVYTRYTLKVDYKAIKKISEHLKLTKLSLRSSIVYEESENRKDMSTKNASLNNLQHLDIGRFSNGNAWLLFVQLHLPLLGNLQSLSIFIDLANCVLITDGILKTIQEACPKLQKLSFEQCKFRTNRFILPRSLLHLSLTWCWGVTWQHFAEIFREYLLEKFDSINCYYDDHDVDLLYTSNSLTTLTMETSIIPDFVELLKNENNYVFPQVTTFNWLNSSESTYTPPQGVCYNLSTIFPQLKVLNLEQTFIPLKEFQQMSTLQSLRISMYDSMTWSYMLTLLQSTSLQSLVIDIPSNLCTPLCPILITKPELHFATTPLLLSKSLKYLEIPVQLSCRSLDFWLDLRSRNSEMKLKCYALHLSEITRTLLKALLNHPTFATLSKYINICNNEIACSELRKRLTNIMYDYEFNCDTKGQYFIII
ncbi:uncharacterized protein [Musca autumnalis]|uniref:uncharacterized protein n=1 Tax=Musca autumnalis TaxID=221902 RepID=UPI003CF6CA2D